jgi:hypothetical protein
MPSTGSDLLLLVAPLIVLEIVLIVLALNDLVRRDRVRFGNKWVWGAVILCVSLLGPVAYFVLGREDE